MYSQKHNEVDAEMTDIFYIYVKHRKARVVSLHRTVTLLDT